jgi:hypothetical protein
MICRQEGRLINPARIFYLLEFLSIAISPLCRPSFAEDNAKSQGIKG